MSRINPSRGFSNCHNPRPGRFPVLPFLIGLALADKIGLGFGRLILSTPASNSLRRP